MILINTEGSIKKAKRCKMDKLKKLFIKPSVSINRALRQMDEAAEKILFVVDNEDILLGSVTDGDIRRWILKGKSLVEKISKVMNKSSKYLQEGFLPEEAKKIMIDYKIESLPVLNKRKQLVAVINWLDFFKTKFKRHQMIDLPVVIMAGGEGSRLAPFTKILPKPLMPIGDKPIIEIIMNRFSDYGCKDFYLSLNYKSNIIRAYFSDIEHEYKITYIQEKRPLGTAGSLYLLRGKIKKTFFVSNCDTLIEADYADILRFHKGRKNKITLISSMKNFIIPYGVCEIKNGGVLGSIREKPEFDYLVNTGMYMLDASVINDIPRNNVYNITDLINDYLEKSKEIGVYPISEKSWLDVGQLEEYQKSIKVFGIQ